MKKERVLGEKQMLSAVTQTHESGLYQAGHRCPVLKGAFKGLMFHACASSAAGTQKESETVAGKMDRFCSDPVSVFKTRDLFGLV